MRRAAGGRFVPLRCCGEQRAEPPCGALSTKSAGASARRRRGEGVPRRLRRLRRRAAGPDLARGLRRGRAARGAVPGRARRAGALAGRGPEDLHLLQRQPPGAGGPVWAHDRGRPAALPQRLLRHDLRPQGAPAPPAACSCLGWRAPPAALRRRRARTWAVPLTGAQSWSGRSRRASARAQAEAGSYREIALALGVDAPDRVLFATDVEAEAVAAAVAGWQAGPARSRTGRALACGTHGAAGRVGAGAGRVRPRWALHDAAWAAALQPQQAGRERVAA